MPVYDPELIYREIDHYKPIYKGVTHNDEIRKELRGRGVEEHNIKEVIKDLERTYRGSQGGTKIYEWLLLICGSILLLMSIFLVKFLWGKGFLLINVGMFTASAAMITKGIVGIARK